jgi:hypothetical protein
MSMTQVAFLRKANLPTSGQIQQALQNLGYDFKILGNQEKRIDQIGLECSINGYQTFFESYLDDANDIIASEGLNWIKQDLMNQDVAITFSWGADYAAGACIGLISIALIDLSDALIYYIDDEMKYTREMLVADTPQFLEELNKQAMKDVRYQVVDKSNQSHSNTRRALWDRLIGILK